MPKRKKAKINKKSKSKSIAKENNNSKDKLQKKNYGILNSNLRNQNKNSSSDLSKEDNNIEDNIQKIIEYSEKEKKTDSNQYDKLTKDEFIIFEKYFDNYDVDSDDEKKEENFFNGISNKENKQEILIDTSNNIIDSNNDMINITSDNNTIYINKIDKKKRKFLYIS